MVNICNGLEKKKAALMFTMISVCTNELKSDYSLIKTYKSGDSVQNDVFDDPQM